MDKYKIDWPEGVEDPTFCNIVENKPEPEYSPIIACVYGSSPDQCEKDATLMLKGLNGHTMEDVKEALREVLKEDRDEPVKVVINPNNLEPEADHLGEVWGKG